MPKMRKSGVRYEGVAYDEMSQCCLPCVLFSNEEGVTIVVPDEPDLDEVFRGGP